MNNSNFKISEFVIDGNSIPLDIADKIQKNFINPLQAVRDVFKKKIYISEKSGYRSVQWEVNHKRSGNSQHCFKGKGASDVTFDDFKDFLKDFIDIVLKETKFTRIAIYKNFVHLDYKRTPSGKTEIYKNSPDGWELIKIIKN